MTRIVSKIYTLWICAFICALTSTLAHAFPIDEFVADPATGVKHGLVMKNAETWPNFAGEPFFVDNQGMPHFRKYSTLNTCTVLGGDRTLILQTCPMAVPTEDPDHPGLYGFCSTTNIDEKGEGTSSCYSWLLAREVAMLNSGPFARVQTPGTGSAASWIIYDGDNVSDNINVRGLRGPNLQPGINLSCGNGSAFESEAIDFKCPFKYFYWDQKRKSNYCAPTPIFTITVFDINGNSSSATAVTPEIKMLNQYEGIIPSVLLSVPFSQLQPLSGQAAADLSKIGAIQVMWELQATKRGLPHTLRDKSSLNDGYQPKWNEAFNIRYLRTNGGTLAECTSKCGSVPPEPTAATPTPVPTATPSTPIKRNCTEFHGKDQQLAIDNNAHRQRNRIRSSVQRALSLKFITKKQAQGFLNESASIFKDLWSNIWGYPSTVVSCDNTVNCAVVSFDQGFRVFERRSQDNIELAQRIVKALPKRAQKDFASLPKSMAGLVKRNLELLSTFPKQTVSCPK